MVAQIINLTTRRKAKQTDKQLLTPQTLLDRQAALQASIERMRKLCDELKEGKPDAVQSKKTDGN